MEIDYEKISIEELERLSFLHAGTFNFMCDADTKKVILEKIEEE
jgi:hypothetical protein